MSFFNRLIAVIVSAALISPVIPLEAKTRKGDKFLAQGRVAETKKDWDAALDFFEKALSEDPAEVVYQMSVQKARFEASAMHLDAGLKMRAQGQLGEALIEFQKAYAINPGSVVASQETQLTQEMIARERKKVQETGKESPSTERALTPVEQLKKNEMNRIGRILSVPELKPINPAPINLRIAGQKIRTVYDTIAKYAGINVVWDPEFVPPTKDSFNVDLDNESLENALDIVSAETHLYWKALSPNTIFITNDNANKRRDYEEQVTKVFYLQNVSTPAELQEIVNVVRTAADINRVFPYNAQFALVVRGEADRVELATKLIHDLDKPKSEVLVDLLVIEASSTFSRQITAAIASTGLNVPFTFAPRSSIQTTINNSSNNNNNNNNSGVPNTNNGSSSTTGSFIPLSNLSHVSSADFATTLPSALLQAAMSDAKTRVLQAPQLRAVDNQKASLKIGEREPTASGSFQPGVGGIGVNPLVNTQFTYLDVGVNVDMLARVHDNNEVSMHITLEISNITGQVNLGGINEPVIGQRKVDCDLRMKEGEVGLLGGLINQEDDTTVTGIPGLSSIPLLGKLFSGNSANHNRDELMIVLVPHILRRPEITPENVRSIAVGNATVIQLHHAPPAVDANGNAPAPLPGAAAPPADQPPAGVPPAAGQPQPTPAGPPVAAPTTQPAGPLPPATAPPLPPGMVPQPTGGAAPAAAGQPSATGKVRFNQSSIDVSSGQPVNVSVVVEGASDVVGAPMRVQFDPKVLRLNDAAAGDFLSSDGQQPIFAKNIMNDAGQAVIQLNRLPGVAGVTAPSGTLVTLQFQAVGKGSTVVSIPNMLVSNSQGGPAATGSPQVTVTVK